MFSSSLVAASAFESTSMKFMDESCNHMLYTMMGLSTSYSRRIIVHYHGSDSKYLGFFSFIVD